MNFGTLIGTPTSNKKLYITQKLNIEQFTSNWKHNRPIDSVRVENISRHYVDTNKTWIDHIIYAWLHNNVLFIYDGWNRYYAASKNMKFILSVLDTDDEKDVIDDFTVLNLAVPVPEIYNGTDSHKKDLLEKVCQLFDERYGDLKKPSKNPRCPHYNRDKLMQLLGDLTIPFETINAQQFFNGICKANDELGNSPINFPEKAREYNFYLFATKDIASSQVIIKHIISSAASKSTFANRIKGLFT